MNTLFKNSFQAMKLREAERMRFWREELPEQIEIARQTWILEMKAQHTSVNPDNKDLKDKGIQTKKFVSVDKAVNASHISTSSIHVQTELCDLLSVKFGLTLNDPTLISFRRYLSIECLHYLCTHLTETSSMNLSSLEREISNSAHVVLKHLFQGFLKQIDGEVDRLVNEYRVAHIFNENADKNFPIFTSLSNSLNNESTKSTEIIEQSSTDTCTLNFSFKNSEIQLSKSADSEYQSLITKIRVLALNLSESNECLRKLRNSSLNRAPNSCEHKYIQVSGLEAPHYYSTLEKIKVDVLNYVELCQSRAAQTLHSELARVHRRACRQFTGQLRQALHDAGAPVFPTVRREHFPGKNTNLLNNVPLNKDSSPTKKNPIGASGYFRDLELTEGFQTDVTSPNSHTYLESLLHVIDEVCASTEARFYTDTTTGSRLFSRLTESKSHSKDCAQHQHIDSSYVNNDAEVVATSSQNAVVHTPYIMPKNKRDRLLTPQNCFATNPCQELSVTSSPDQFPSEIKPNDSLSPKIANNIHSKYLSHTENVLPSTHSSNSTVQMKFVDSNTGKPIPTPRITRPYYDNFVKLSKPINLLQSTPVDSTCSDSCDRKPVHTELYKLFENLYSNQLPNTTTTTTNNNNNNNNNDNNNNNNSNNNNNNNDNNNNNHSEEKKVLQ
ncbi:unnamed protein product [Heterobilharzia americana]|nr:unnamed protein product [Heterobilharzia americana]